MLPSYLSAQLPNRVSSQSVFPPPKLCPDVLSIPWTPTKHGNTPFFIECKNFISHQQIKKNIHTNIQTSLNFSAISLHVWHFSFAQSEVDNSKRNTKYKYILSTFIQHEFTASLHRKPQSASKIHKFYATNARFLFKYLQYTSS
jgi:hypothetical protein